MKEEFSKEEQVALEEYVVFMLMMQDEEEWEQKDVDDTNFGRCVE